jgi:hypothetical protein
LPIHGARPAILQRRHPNVVSLALANKSARIAWSLLTSDSVHDASLSVSLKAISNRKDNRPHLAIAIDWRMPMRSLRRFPNLVSGPAWFPPTLSGR